MELYYVFSEKHNVVNSAFLVVFDKIFKENKKDLIMHIVSLDFLTTSLDHNFIGRKFCRGDLETESPKIFQKNSHKVRPVQRFNTAFPNGDDIRTCSTIGAIIIQFSWINVFAGQKLLWDWWRGRSQGRDHSWRLPSWEQEQTRWVPKNDGREAIYRRGRRWKWWRWRRIYPVFQAEEALSKDEWRSF